MVIEDIEDNSEENNEICGTCFHFIPRDDFPDINGKPGWCCKEKKEQFMTFSTIMKCERYQRVK